jgi:hypothetical protein
VNYSNNTDIPLALAVWVLADNYDYNKDQDYISATALMKPLRQIILTGRVEGVSVQPDVSDRVASSIGNAFHDSIEKAWKTNHQKALAQLGYPQSVIDRVLINPTEAELAKVESPIPVYIEQRAVKQVGKWKVGGKFDIIIDGVLHDNKSTSAYVWLFGSRDDEHSRQGSIYRWLNPEKVSEDIIRINYIFTDWKRVDAMSNPDYPQQRLLHKDIPLTSIQETQGWVENKLALIERFMNAPEKDIPECTDEELWLPAPVFKFYSDPTKITGRSTKNFKTLGEANSFHQSKGKGVVIPIVGSPKRCGYCSAFDACTQKDRYNHD